jgi:hypothetical protein
MARPVKRDCVRRATGAAATGTAARAAARGRWRGTPGRDPGRPVGARRGCDLEGLGWATGQAPNRGKAPAPA